MGEKMMRRLNRRGQSTMEFVVLFVVVIAALIAMQVYLKRGLQGRLRSSSDQLGEQFSPGYTVSNLTTATYSDSTEEVGTAAAGGKGMTKITLTNQWQNTAGTEVVQSMGNEYWGK